MATVDVLFSGYANDRVAGTVSCVRDDNLVAIVDPERDTWTERDADGAQLSDEVQLIATPGHTAQDITTLVHTAVGLVALTHAWWDSASHSDALAEDLDLLSSSRRRILQIASLIVPEHGQPFRPAPDSHDTTRSEPRTHVDWYGR